MLCFQPPLRISKQPAHQLWVWEMKTQGYLILFFHLAFGFNYQTKLVSNVTNGWRHRHLTPTAQAFYCVLGFTKKILQCDSHFNYKSVEQKADLKYWWETICLWVVLDLNNQSQIRVDCTLLAHLSHTDHRNHQKQQAFTSVTVSQSH